MYDSFQNHSNDWSKVPRPEALSPLPYVWSGPSRPAPIRLDQAYTFQVPIYADDYRRAPVGAPLSVGVAYVLWLLFGLLGAHYFYIGKPMIGVLWLLTGGLLGIGWIVDLFTLKGQVERANRY